MTKMGSKGSAGIAVVMILLAIGFSLANLFVYASSSDPSGGTAADLGPLLASHYRTCPGCVIYFGVTPLLFGLLGAFVAIRRAPSATARSAAQAATATPEAETSALRLLSLLQQEGRFIDFIRENIDSYDDAQVGGAARTIHSGCRKALAGRIEVEKILPQAEGDAVRIDPGFDPASVRLIGNVRGNPPFQGTLAHSGWRVSKVQLPESPGKTDPSIIAPAEVEID